MNEVQKSLKKRYSHLHPLIFSRSMEKATTDGELFDILESVPDKLPVIWDEEKRSWVHSENLLQDPGE